jgi:uncharacterized protein YukE
MAGGPPLLTTSDYSAWTIAFSSEQLQDTSNKLTSLATGIANQLEDIINTLDDLSLSWVGQSQQLENTYNQEWQAAVATLFGTSKNPEKGVLVQVASALASAAGNYAAGEYWGQGAYLQFMIGLTSGGGNTSSPPPASPVTNPLGQTVTAITETFS